MLTAQQFKFHLARYAKVKESEADAFMDAVTQVLLEKVQAGEEVEIQGLGTFMVIDSQQGRRLGFQVDEKMRRAVNAPFACFEPMTLAATPDGKPAVEVAEEPEEDAEETYQVAEEKEHEVTFQVTSAPIVEVVPNPEPEVVPELEPEPEVAPEPEAAPAPESEPTPTPAPVVTPKPKRKVEPSAMEVIQEKWKEVQEKWKEIQAQLQPQLQQLKEGKVQPWMWGALAGIVVLLVLIIWLLIPSGKKEQAVEPAPTEVVADSLQNESDDAEVKMEDGADKTAAQNENAPVAKAESKPVAKTESKPAAKPAAAEPAKPARGKRPADEMLWRENGEPKMQSLNDGSRLTLLALSNYGNKAFWAYIYDVNAFQLGDPNNVPIGRPLYLPDSTYFKIDANDPASVKRAQVRAMQILNEWK